MPLTLTDFEPRKFAPMPESQQQPSQQPAPQQQPQQSTRTPQTPQQQLLQTDPLQQMTSFKSQPIETVPPRVLEYSPHFGPEGQTFTVTLQSNTDKTLRIGFGTLVVDTKQYAANGYVTLSCTVPNFAITKWFVSKVPLYVLQMENDMVMESWPFGDYNYYDDNSQSNTSKSNKRGNVDNLLYGQNQSPVASKRQHLVADLDLSNTQLSSQHSHQQQLSPLAPSTPTTTLNGLAPRQDDYQDLSSSAAAYDAGLYSQSLQPTSPYGSRPPMSAASYARSGYYNTNQMIAPHMPSYSQPELGSSSGYALTSTANHNTNYIQSSNNNNNQQHHHHPQPVAPSSYMPQPHPSAASMGGGGGLPLGGYNPYASLLNKANLKFQGNMDDMAINWSGEEWESHRRLVQFWRRQDGNDIHCTFAPVAPADRQPNSIVVSCIYWAEKNDCFLTSVDCIYLLESLIAVRFTVEEKNRIRRNLEGFRPITVSKCKPESAEFFKLIMSFPNPKPRNIEKDVKVFPWKVLPYALKKIISKYTASYSSTASIQTDAFHNANFPHGSTLPVTPQQQTIIESSILA
ncbi:hypothetical protein EC957_002461 [Mortierella hygrophila]|uniref:DUF7082 domain-containing protein n=1 Tax=Mortierella hygrophila TaxID=979708 RepID=A0A9P6FF70_9FUNG|nr:hypothetical protein EC957_002461 [Mortierella hygrophila]